MKKIKYFFDILDLSKDNFDYCIMKNTELDLTLNKKNIGLIFEKESTRTRISFHVGISKLGGNPIEIKLNDLNLNRYESFEDTFRALECYLDGIVFRTNDHKKLINASNFFSKPIINALSEKSHPCQIISDIYTLYEHFNRLDLNILWVGDMNNVCFSLTQSLFFLEKMRLFIYSPKQISSLKNWKINDNTNIINNLNDIDLSRIDCVMTDVFISMNDSEKDNLKNEALKTFLVDDQLMKKTSEKSVFMHCLPAKVGHEVTKEVINGKHSIVWKQAKNRMFAQNNLFQCLDW